MGLNPLKDMGLDPASMLAFQDTMQKIAAVMSILPPIEIKDDFTRKFSDPDDPRNFKKYVAIFIEKPEKPQPKAEQ
jgi:hypothetical protein